MTRRRIVTEAQQAFSFTRRAMVLGGIQIGVGTLLAGRMAWLAIAQNEKYSLLAESNRVNLTLIPPRRGWIVDRAGKPLALNRTAFRVDLIPDRVVDREAVLAQLQSILALPQSEIDRIRADLGKAFGFQPVAVVENLDWERFAAISLRAPDLPGVAPAQSYARFYPAGAAVGHLAGYVGAASAKEYQKTRDPLMITPGFKVGKEGLERVFEPQLRGRPGARRSEVTARGKLVRELETRPDLPGGTLKLTIDAGLQEYAARRMGDQSSALVCIDCTNGDLLAMASMPAYDPNRFSDGISHSEWEMLSTDDHLPLLNKSLQGLFPPGSTSKPMTALALLKAGIDPEARINCSGAYRVGNSLFHCSQRRGHGPIAMHEAIVKSCDIYFYHFARLAGIAPLAEMARTMGLGVEFDLPVVSQRYGTVPDPEWLKRRYDKNWSTFDTVNTSIGQGYMLVNPLQLAVMTGRMASGRALVPRLTAGASTAPPLAVDRTHLDFVRTAMAEVVNSGRGTASVARLPVPGVLMAGKTGTAQVRRITMAERAGGVRSNASLAWRQRDHSLFIAYAPADAPRYAIGCIVEHGGFGASAAAPLVRDTMTYLFDPALAQARLDAEEKSLGGTLQQRMDKRLADYTRARQAASAPKGSVDDDEIARDAKTRSAAEAVPAEPITHAPAPEAEPAPDAAPGNSSSAAPQP